MPKQTMDADWNEPIKIENERKSKPKILVVALMGSLFVSSVANMFSSAFWQFQSVPASDSLALMLVLQQVLGFPFSITCIVWIAARSGHVRWTTWIVPLIPLILITIANRNDYSSFSTSLIAYVCLEFLFRASSLHLRPVEGESSPKKLTVLSLFGLMIAVAIGMSIDLVFKTRSAMDSSLGDNATTLLAAASYGIYYVSTGLVWFSVAWFWVANNPSRYIAFIGLGIHLAIDFIQIAVLLPFWYDESTLKSFYGPVYIIGTMVVDVLHIGLVFACVATMHVAGYRWDIRRRSLVQQT